MMYSVFFIFLCVALSGVNPATYIAIQEEIPGHEGECHDEDTNIFIKAGEIVNHKGTECSQWRCSRSFESGKMIFEIVTCGTAEIYGFKVLPNPSLPYPECCAPKIPYNAPCSHDHPPSSRGATRPGLHLIGFCFVIFLSIIQ